MKEMQKYNTITTDYASVVLRRTAKCELKARMFEAEIEFPPFEFLKTSGTGLMDFKVMNACLLSD